MIVSGLQIATNFCTKIWDSATKFNILDQWIYSVFFCLFFLHWYVEGANQRIWNLESQVAGQWVWEEQGMENGTVSG